MSPGSSTSVGLASSRRRTSSSPMLSSSRQTCSRVFRTMLPPAPRFHRLRLMPQSSAAGARSPWSATRAVYIDPMIRCLCSRLGLVVALVSSAWAQDERWQVALDDGSYVWDIRLVRLAGDSLVVRQWDSLVSVPVAHI